MIKRDEFINIPPAGTRARVGELERVGLELLAIHEGVNVSEAVRIALREACKSRGLWPPKVEVRR